MILAFIVALFLTFIVTRIFSHILDGGKRPEPKTLTGLIRKKTGKDIHHIHMGIIIVVLTLVIMFIDGLSNYKIIYLGMGLSLIADQIPVVYNFYNYFERKAIISAFLLHILIALFGIIVFIFF
jgi:hypothetical protein